MSALPIETDAKSDPKNDRMAYIETSFETPGITVERTTYRSGNFRFAVIILLLSATLSCITGIFNPGVGLGLALLITLTAVREFYHPFIGSRIGTPTANLYFTIPARSKETQKLYLVATFGTDDLFVKPNPIKFNQFLRIYHSAFGCTLFGTLLAFSTGTKALWVVAILPLAAVGIWISTFPKISSRDALPNCKVLSELKNLLMKARPLSTSVTFALLGSRSLHSGARQLAKKVKNDALITYMVNLTDNNAIAKEQITLIASEENIFPKASDPTLIELFQMIAGEKGIRITESSNWDLTEIFPLLQGDLKVVSIGTTQTADPHSNRNLRELLAGLVRKLEH